MLHIGVNGEWIGAWILLHHRTFYYATDVYGAKNIDLRKARTIGIQTPQESEFTPRTQDKGPNMLLDYAFGSLYLRMWTCRETKAYKFFPKQKKETNLNNLLICLGLEPRGENSRTLQRGESG